MLNEVMSVFRNEHYLTNVSHSNRNLSDRMAAIKRISTLHIRIAKHLLMDRFNASKKYATL